MSYRKIENIFIRTKQKGAKMSRKEININSLEELVSFVLKPENKYEAKERYSLVDNSNYDYKKKKHVIERYYLYRSSGWLFSSSINIPIELGEMLDSVWTKKAPYRTADYKTRYGSLSLLGILKRLGKDKEVSKKFKAAELESKRQIEKQTRNSARRQIRETATKLSELLAKNEAILPNHAIEPVDLVHLIDLEDEV